ncbi:hypothetical protein GH714_032046 [Hevea brasiliensis]|uniref:DUF4283 domain-containing protein n=1 Tax=Hevea brasiliensis TaxID=3981 RepID=A0A6A6KMK7_HEVBR|nr:hypothetical protein GH714_032046 [Hevea brasiliensis]
MVKLLGRQLGYKFLCFRIESLWKPLGWYAIIDLDNGYCLIKFITEEDVQRALFGGPWVVMGHYLTMESWNPSFNPASHLPSKIVAWVGHTNVRYPSQVSGNGDLGNGNKHINQEFRMAMDGGRQPKQWMP